MTNAEIVVAGTLCLDITPVFSSKASSSEPQALDSYIKPGALSRLDDVQMHTGGVVANVGLAMHHFGASVSLQGKIGNDSFGLILKDLLAQENAAKDIIIDPSAKTSFTIVLAPPALDRSFLHSPGANDSFCLNDLNLAHIQKAKIFHFGYPPLMLKMYQNEGKELVELLKTIHQTETLTSLDLSSVDPQSKAALENWDAILKRALPYTDFFVPSLEELAFMLDKPLYNKINTSGLSSVSIENDVQPLAQTVLRYGAKLVMIKLGERGLFCMQAASSQERKGIAASGFTNCTQAQNGFLVPAYKPKRVLSATGAGDVAISAFLTSFLRGYSLERAARLAAAAGATCVETYDALSGLTSLEELEDKIQKGWPTA